MDEEFADFAQHRIVPAEIGEGRCGFLEGDGSGVFLASFRRLTPFEASGLFKPGRLKSLAGVLVLLPTPPPPTSLQVNFVHYGSSVQG